MSIVLISYTPQWRTFVKSVRSAIILDSRLEYIYKSLNQPEKNVFALKYICVCV